MIPQLAFLISAKALPQTRHQNLLLNTIKVVNCPFHLERAIFRQLFFSW